MDVKEILIQVAIAALSVIGLYGILQGFLDSFAPPRAIVTAVVIRSKTPPEELELLLSEARRSLTGGRKRPLLLVIHTDLLDGDMGRDGRLFEAYATLAEEYGAQVCLMDTKQAQSLP